jgi:hypothetical protein
VPDPVIVPANQPIDPSLLNDGKPRAIIRSGSKRAGKLKVESNSPPPPPDLNVPTLWIKGNDGIVHLLDTPAPAEARTESAGIKPARRKPKKGDLSLRRSFYKPDSPDGNTVYSALIIDDEIFTGAIQGVKITCEVDTEITQMKDEDVQQTLLQQQLQIQKDQAAKSVGVTKKFEEKRKEIKKPALMKRRPIIRSKGNKLIQNNEYLYHIPHPNLMCPLFELPPLGQILYGPYEKEVQLIEKQLWQTVLYRGPENIIFAQS